MNYLVFYSPIINYYALCIQKIIETGKKSYSNIALIYCIIVLFGFYFFKKEFSNLVLLYTLGYILKSLINIIYWPSVQNKLKPTLVNNNKIEEYG